MQKVLGKIQAKGVGLLFEGKIQEVVNEVIDDKSKIANLKKLEKKYGFENVASVVMKKEFFQKVFEKFIKTNLSVIQILTDSQRVSELNKFFLALRFFSERYSKIIAIPSIVLRGVLCNGNLTNLIQLKTMQDSGHIVLRFELNEFFKHLDRTILSGIDVERFQLILELGGKDCNDKIIRVFIDHWMAQFSNLASNDVFNMVYCFQKGLLTDKILKQFLAKDDKSLEDALSSQRTKLSELSDVSIYNSNQDRENFKLNLILLYCFLQLPVSLGFNEDGLFREIKSCLDSECKRTKKDIIAASLSVYNAIDITSLNIRNKLIETLFDRDVAFWKNKIIGKVEYKGVISARAQLSKLSLVCKDFVDGIFHSNGLPSEIMIAVLSYVSPSFNAFNSFPALQGLVLYLTTYPHSQVTQETKQSKDEIEELSNSMSAKLTLEDKPIEYKPIYKFKGLELIYKKIQYYIQENLEVYQRA
jgi:hypothetical protein